MWSNNAGSSDNKIAQTMIKWRVHKQKCATDGATGRGGPETVQSEWSSPDRLPSHPGNISFLCLGQDSVLARGQSSWHHGVLGLPLFEDSSLVLCLGFSDG